MKIYKKQEVDKDVLTLARERISKAFDEFDHIAVAFSGGKDSTVALNLALEEAHKRGGEQLPLDVIFSDEEAIPYQTEDYVRRVYNRDDVNLRWLAIPMVHRNNCSTKFNYWYHWAPEKKEKWVREKPPEAITEVPFYTGKLGTKLNKIRQEVAQNDEYNYSEPKGRLAFFQMNGLFFYPPEKYGKVGLIMGIRAQESLNRHRAVSRRKQENYIVKDSGSAFSSIPFKKLKLIKPKNVWKIYPVYDWQTEDVWTATKKFEWDYNEAYDLMDKLGFSPLRQRVAPPFHREGIKDLYMFKTCFPEIWEKLYKRVPGASTASRYGNTQLYSKHSKIEKPEGLSWREFIKNELEKIPSKADRKQLAQTVRGHIKNHYNKTDEPILPYTPHWYTGISWSFIAGCVVQGDYLNRRRPQANLDKMADAKDSYYQALEEYKQARKDKEAK